MQFTPTTPKGAVRITFTEGSVSKFVEKDGQTELRIGYGKEKPLPRRKLTLLLRKVINTAKQNKITEISLDWQELRAVAGKKISDNDLGQLTATAFVMADYDFTLYKTPPKEGFSHVATVAIPHVPAPTKRGGFSVGEMVGAAVNATRDLSNTPGGDMTPKILAEAAKKAAKGTKATVKVLGRKDMEKLGMGAVLGMGRGSAHEPQFIIVEYHGGPKSQQPIVLIGKGVTFDTGGLNIKPGDHMYEMHMDMSGGAAVIHTAILAAKLGLKANVVALVPAVENGPGPDAVRPGDILKSLSGKTIEVLNTDAEGRVILSDAITYAKRYNPQCVVDAATLTGAAFVALGTQASGLMSNNQKFEDELRELGEESGDYVWPLPLWDEYEDMVRGHFGDVPNISTMGNSRDGGSIAGGMFLLQFAKELDCPWAHLDIAPKMTAAPNDLLAKGAMGTPVRLLTKLIIHRTGKKR